ncbi:hypothetical protein Leryth_017304 [Lithospermum erythrorhizon]|nr:hypothetical protein Leryth_017304 [Lithospermum erythrorhizon]
MLRISRIPMLEVLICEVLSCPRWCDATGAALPHSCLANNCQPHVSGTSINHTLLRFSMIKINKLLDFQTSFII